MTKTRATTPAGRRASLIVRMSNAAREAGVVPRRIHLVVAIDRLLVRLLQAAPGQWVVKGGYANKLRVPPDSWTRPYQVWRAELDLAEPTPAAAASALRSFLEPIYFAVAGRSWDPTAQEWR